ncbi:unnamed protein product, partial [marine sediment metagenome]
AFRQEQGSALSNFDIGNAYELFRGGMVPGMFGGGRMKKMPGFVGGGEIFDPDEGLNTVDKFALDLLTGIIPGIGTVKDISELIRGKSTFGGEDLGAFGYGVTALSAMISLLPAGSVIGKLLKGAGISKGAFKGGRKAIEALAEAAPASKYTAFINGAAEIAEGGKSLTLADPELLDLITRSGIFSDVNAAFKLFKERGVSAVIDPALVGLNKTGLFNPNTGIMKLAPAFLRKGGLGHFFESMAHESFHALKAFLKSDIGEAAE